MSEPEFQTDMPLSESMQWLQQSLKQTIQSTAELQFEETRHRFNSLIDLVAHRIRTALPGQEYDGLVSFGFELGLLAWRLGLTEGSGPIAHKHDSETKRITSITFSQVRSGTNLEVRADAELKPILRKFITARLNSWKLGANAQLPQHFRPSPEVSTRVFAHVMVLLLAEIISALTRVTFHPVDESTPDITYEELSIGVGLSINSLRGLVARTEGVRKGKKGKKGHLLSLAEVRLLAAAHAPMNPNMRKNWQTFIEKIYLERSMQQNTKMTPA